jgi:hypothetical protein
LLALTVADYALWHWSIAGGHDILLLVSGLTLLPLAAATLALLALGAARLCGGALERAHDRRRRPPRHAHAHARTHTTAQSQTTPPPHTAAAERAPERGSRRLAA